MVSAGWRGVGGRGKWALGGGRGGEKEAKESA